MDITDRTLLYALDRIISHLGEKGSTADWEAIQYGVKIEVVTAQGKKCSGVLYHSPKKRRFSWVPGKSKDAASAQFLQKIVMEVTGLVAINGGNGKNAPKNIDPLKELPASEQKLICWIGTDEAGKGDLFGPLVVGGFIADQKIVPELIKLGVRDSKELSPGTIKKIADELHDKYEDRIALVQMLPHWYNDIYPDYKESGGINGLLGWGHAAAIGDLTSRDYPVEKAVVDQFAGKNRITDAYDDDGKYAPLILRTGAESNPAVAAAAILARDAYDFWRERIKGELGWKPHAGSGSAGKDDLLRLYEEKPDELYKYVKMHFNPVKNLTGEL